MTTALGDRSRRFAALRADPRFDGWTTTRPSIRPVLLRGGIQATAGFLMLALGAWFARASPAPAAGEETLAITRILPIVNAVAGAALSLWALWKIAAFLRGSPEAIPARIAEVRTQTPGAEGTPRADDPIGSVVVVIENDAGERREVETPAAVAAHFAQGAYGVAQIRSGWLLGFATPESGVISERREPSAPR